MLFDGQGRLKLLEYNADTPTVLVESSVAQENWLALKNYDRSLGNQKKVATFEAAAGTSVENDTWLVQFNRIEEMLVMAWTRWHARAGHFEPTTILPHLYFAYPEDPGPTKANKDTVEEYETVMYLMKTATKAGLTAEACRFGQIPQEAFGPGSDISAKEDRSAADASNSSSGGGGGGGGGDGASCVWKLYPWEWIAAEPIVADIDQGKIKMMEPAWKAILSNKALLPMLWEKFPNHRLLLPAHFHFSDHSYDHDDHHDRQTGGGDRGEGGSEDDFDAAAFVHKHEWVSKPRYGREGMGVVYSNFTGTSGAGNGTRSNSNGISSTGISSIVSSSSGGGGGGGGLDTIASFHDEAHHPSNVELHDGHGNEICLGKPIYQKYEAPQPLMGRFNVIGSWVVGGQPAGIGIREDLNQTTSDDSCFVPHIVVDDMVAEDPRNAASHMLPALKCSPPRGGASAGTSAIYGDKDLTTLNTKHQAELRRHLYGDCQLFEKNPRYWCSHQGTLPAFASDHKGGWGSRIPMGFFMNNAGQGQGKQAPKNDQRTAAPKKSGAATAAAGYKPTKHSFDRRRTAAGKSTAGGAGRKTGGMRWGGGG